MGVWKGRVGDHPFGPLQRLLFAGLVGGHVAVASFDILRYDVGTSELLDELTDAAPADGAVKALIDGLADSDCELSVHGIAYTYCIRTGVEFSRGDANQTEDGRQETGDANGTWEPARNGAAWSPDSSRREDPGEP